MKKNLVLLALAAICGCSASEAARNGCKIVEAAHQGCILLRYTDPSGAVQEVHLTSSEVDEIGRAAAARKGK